MGSKRVSRLSLGYYRTNQRSLVVHSGGALFVSLPPACGRIGIRPQASATGGMRHLSAAVGRCGLTVQRAARREIASTSHRPAVTDWRARNATDTGTLLHAAARSACLVRRTKGLPNTSGRIFSAATPVNASSNRTCSAGTRSHFATAWRDMPMRPATYRGPPACRTNALIWSLFMVRFVAQGRPCCNGPLPCQLFIHNAQLCVDSNKPLRLHWGHHRPPR